MNQKVPSIVSLWAARIGALVVLASCFVANEAIDHDSLEGYQKGAFAILFLFGLFGSMAWIRSTYSAAELQKGANSRLVKVAYGVLGVALVVMTLVFASNWHFGG